MFKKTASESYLWTAFGESAVGESWTVQGRNATENRGSTYLPRKVPSHTTFK